MKKTSKNRKITKVPSMIRFGTYLRTTSPRACDAAEGWLDRKNFRTVKEAYEELISLDSWDYRAWVRWVLCDDPEIWKVWRDPYGTPPPPWKEARHALKRLVDSLVNLDGTRRRL